MSILFLARKLASDFGLIEQVQENNSHNQFNYRFYSSKPDPKTNTLYGAPGSGFILQNNIFIYWFRDGNNSYVIESTKKLTKDKLDILHRLLIDNLHSLDEIIDASASSSIFSRHT
ncbi:hypothetical protein EP47_10360, partial [Legionella norrlandica]